MYSSSYQVPAVNINQSISPKAHFLGCFGMGTFIQSTSLKARFLEAAPSSGFKSYDLKPDDGAASKKRAFSEVDWIKVPMPKHPKK